MTILNYIRLSELCQNNDITRCKSSYFTISQNIEETSKYFDIVSHDFKISQNVKKASHYFKIVSQNFEKIRRYFKSTELNFRVSDYFEISQNLEKKNKSLLQNTQSRFNFK